MLSLVFRFSCSIRFVILLRPPEFNFFINSKYVFARNYVINPTEASNWTLYIYIEYCNRKYTVYTVHSRNTGSIVLQIFK